MNLLAYNKQVSREADGCPAVKRQPSPIGTQNVTIALDDPGTPIISIEAIEVKIGKETKNNLFVANTLYNSHNDSHTIFLAQCSPQK